MKNSTNYKEYSNSTTYKIAAREAEYLYIKESQIPGSGNGLFTSIPIYKDEVISHFKGEFLSDKEAKQRALKGADTYFIRMPDGKILDSNHVKCFAKYANDALGLIKTKFKINAKIMLSETGKICIVASKNISSNEEIFCQYGLKYWQNFEKNCEPKEK
jgi:uncharacterized protein